MSPHQISPSVYALSAATMNDGSFVSSVLRVGVNANPEVIRSEELGNPSLEDKLWALHRQAKIAFSSQRLSNQDSGFPNLFCPVVIGHPANAVYDDAPHLFKIVERTREALGTPKGIYVAEVHQVLPMNTPEYPESTKVDKKFEAFCKNLVTQARVNNRKGKEALSKLRNLAFQLGNELGLSCKDFFYSGKKETFQSMEEDLNQWGARFSLRLTKGMGDYSKNLFNFFDLRSWYAKGFREALNYSKDCVLCVKSQDVDTRANSF